MVAGGGKPSIGVPFSDSNNDILKKTHYLQQADYRATFGGIYHRHPNLELEQPTGQHSPTCSNTAPTVYEMLLRIIRDRYANVLHTT